MPRPRKFDEDAVVQQAMALFWRRGWHATSIDELVKATGLNRGSLYGAFGDKRGLFLRALQRYRDDIAGREIAILRGHEIGGDGWDEEKPPAERLRAYFDHVIRFSLSDEGLKLGCLLTNTAVELGADDPKAWAAVISQEASLEAAFHDCLAEAEVEEPEARARFLVAAAQGLRVTARMAPDEKVLRGVVSSALELLGLLERSVQ